MPSADESSRPNLTGETFKHTSASALIFLLIALLALALRVGTALQIPSLAHPDQVFQSVEPAHRLAYGYGVETWEWRVGARSWVVPAFLALVMRATSWMGPGSSGYLAGIAIVMSLLSLTAVWFGFAWGKRANGMCAAIIAAGACAISYELIYFAPKTLYEVMATHVLLPGLYLGVYGEQTSERKRMVWAGIFCGLAVSLRIQLAPAVAFAVFYICRSNWRARTPAVAAGLLLPIIGFGVVDWFTWSYPFQSFIRYFSVNLIQHRSSIYGTEPWYWYEVILAKNFGPMLLFALLGVRRSPFLGCLALIILVSHSVIPHKEARFLYPLTPLIITLAALGIVEVTEAVRTLGRLPLWPGRGVAGVAVCGLTSGLLAWTAASPGDWSRGSGSLAAMAQLSREPSLCGVGMYQFHWYESGGYAHLHQRVPIVVMETSEWKDTDSFNFALADKPLSDPPANLKLVRCRDGACLYRRPGSCTPPLTNEINAVLQRTNR
jgi:GPI mannosyltransferase 3